MNDHIVICRRDTGRKRRTLGVPETLGVDRVRREHRNPRTAAAGVWAADRIKGVAL